MHPIIESVENNDYNLFIETYNNDTSSLDIIDSDGWSVLSTTTHYEMNNFVEFLLKNMSVEQINNQKPKHPLLIAFENKSELVDLFINHEKINLNIVDKSKENILLYAQRFNRKDLLQTLIDKNVSCFEESVNERSPISYAIETNDIETFNLYYNHIDFEKNYDEKWINQSILCNCPEIFEKLLEHTTLSEDELFDNALNFKNTRIVSILLDSGSIIPGRIQIAKMINLMCNVYSDNKDTESALNIANFLFESNVPFSHFVNTENQSAWTLAIENENDIIFERLIESKDILEITDEKKTTPIFYAIKKKNLYFVKSLLKRGINISQKDKLNNTPLIQAVISGDNEIVKEILKYPNTLINDFNTQQETALSLAIKNKRMDIVSTLIWNGAEITKNPTRIVEQNDIYQIGINGSYEKLFEDINEKEINNFMALNKLGFNLNQTNEIGDTFLIHFIKHGYLSNFKAILKCSLNPNIVDKNGNTALMCAMQKDNPEYVGKLLWKFNNFDYNIKNNFGEDVYDLAKESNDDKKVISLVRNDYNITYENLSKILPIIAMSGSLEDNIDYIQEHKNKFSNYSDDYQNSLLHLSILGNNIQNFKWLLKQDDLKFNLLHVNKNGENISSLIEKLPEEDALKFNQLLSSFLKKNKNKSFSP